MGASISRLFQPAAQAGASLPFVGWAELCICVPCAVMLAIAACQRDPDEGRARPWIWWLLLACCAWIANALLLCLGAAENAWGRTIASAFNSGCLIGAALDLTAYSSKTDPLYARFPNLGTLAWACVAWLGADAALTTTMIKFKSDYYKWPDFTVAVLTLWLLSGGIPPGFRHGERRRRGFLLTAILGFEMAVQLCYLFAPKELPQIHEWVWALVLAGKASLCFWFLSLALPVGPLSARVADAQILPEPTKELEHTPQGLQISAATAAAAASLGLPEADPNDGSAGRGFHFEGVPPGSGGNAHATQLPDDEGAGAVYDDHQKLSGDAGSAAQVKKRGDPKGTPGDAPSEERTVLLERACWLWSALDKRDWKVSTPCTKFEGPDNHTLRIMLDEKKPVSRKTLEKLVDSLNRYEGTKEVQRLAYNDVPGYKKGIGLVTR